MDRKFVTTSFGYAILGLMLGIYMAAVENHSHIVTHAHFMLVGFVVTFIYGLCHRLWLENDTSMLAKFQFYIHQAGTVVMLIGLFFLYGQHFAITTIDPILSASAVAVLVGMVLMAVLFIKSKPRN